MQPPPDMAPGLISSPSSPRESLIFVTCMLDSNNEKVIATTVQGKATKGSVLSGLKLRVSGPLPTPREADCAI